MISVIRQNSAVNYFANGETVTTPDSGVTTLTGAGASQALFSCDIAEVVLYRRALSHGERVRVEKYLADKYGAYHPNATWMQNFPPNIQDQIDANQWSIDQVKLYASFIAEAVPVIPGGLVLWLRADKGVQADKDNGVNAWFDQSPNHHHCYLPAKLPPPELVASSINGQPSIKFNGDTHLETRSIVTNGQNFSVFVVSSLESMGGPFYNGDSARNGWGFYRSSSGTYGFLFGAINEPSFGPLQNPEKTQLLSATRANGVTQFYAFGTSSGTSNSIMAEPSSIATVGGLESGANFTGNIAEILVYNVALNDADRKKIETHLTSKYDLSATPSYAPTNQAPITPQPPLMK